MIPTPVPIPNPLERVLTSDNPLVVFLTALIWALVILLVALAVSRLARTGIVRLMSRSKRISLNIAVLLGNVVSVAVLVLGIVVSLSALGVEWAALVTILGTAGLALSLSLQDVLKNVIAGVYLLVEQPFSIGERISVKDVTGSVESIEIRTTIVRTDEGLQVVIPNNTVFTEIVTNRSATDLHRAVAEVQLRTNSIVSLTGQLTDLLGEIEGVAGTPAPVISLEGVQEGVAQVRVEFWVPLAERVSLTARVVEAIRARFPEADVSVRS
jgi:small conductance mechanosensitive channel